LIEHGYDESFGARPMARVIQDNIKKPLAEELLFGKLEGGGTVRVIVKELEGGKTGLDFEIVEATTKKPLDPDAEPEDSEEEVEELASAKSGKRGKPGGNAPRRLKKPDDDGPDEAGGSGGGSRTSLVPKVPLS
jgi:ATP-dependent Clp protease ATP-binding subunit ClpA